MINVDTKSGHGAGKPTSKSIKEYTDVFCFLIKAIGLQYRKWHEEDGVNETGEKQRSSRVCVIT